jgi:DNA-binding Lrp family transcriptional regulator
MQTISKTPALATALDTSIDYLDRLIITATQNGLPLCAQPYNTIAHQLNINIYSLMRRMRRMQNNGIIRRIGIIPNHYKLGFKFNGMAVWNVPDNKIDCLGLKIGQLNFVSHCYKRPRLLPQWPYNLFAMVHGLSRNEVIQKANVISALLADYNLDHDLLFSTRILKKTGLRIPASDLSPSQPRGTSCSE